MDDYEVGRMSNYEDCSLTMHNDDEDPNVRNITTSPHVMGGRPVLVGKVRYFYLQQVGSNKLAIF